MAIMRNPTRTTPKPVHPSPEEGMTVIDHLKELQQRLSYAGLSVVGGMAIGLFLVMGPVQLVDIIIRAFAPINPQFAPLQTIGTAESFTSYMSVALVVGIIVAMPMIVYQLIAFIAPGLTDKEKRIVFLALPFVMVFFLFGLAFGWFITVPAAIRFLIGFSESALIEVQPNLADFLQTVTVLLLLNGVIFELPIVIYILAFLNLTTARQLSTYRRYAIIIVTVIAAVITPTGDPINLALLAIPMYLLYELGIILAHFVPRRQEAGV